MRQIHINLDCYSTEPENLKPAKRNRKSARHAEFAARLEMCISKCLGEELMIAVQLGDLKRTLSLLERGANTTIKNDAGWGCLTWAAINGHSEVAKALLDHGMSANDKDKSGWPTHLWAVMYGKSDVLKLLLDRGADFYYQDKDGWTLLSYAARHGHVEVGRNLIEWGAKINQDDSYGWTPLMRAVYYENAEFTKMLIEKGADVNRRTSRGQPWLGIDIGWTALMIAARHNKTANIVTILLANGARPNDENAHCKTAANLANNESIAQVFENPPPGTRAQRPLTTV